MITQSDFSSLCEAWAQAHELGPFARSSRLYWRRVLQQEGRCCALEAVVLHRQPSSTSHDGRLDVGEEDELSLRDVVDMPQLTTEWTGTVTIALHPTYQVTITTFLLFKTTFIYADLQVPSVFVRLSNEKGEPATAAILESLFDLDNISNGMDKWIEDDTPLSEGLPALSLHHCCDVPQGMALLQQTHSDKHCDPLYLLNWFAKMGPHFGHPINPREYLELSHILL